MTESLLSHDSLAITLLCAHLGAPRTSGLSPLTDTEWDSLAERLVKSPLKTPAGLFGSSAEQIQASLQIDASQAERVVRLLGRSGAVAFELERLASMGIWVLTRADQEYPRQLRRRLRGRTPALFFGLGDRSSLSAPGAAVVGSRDLDDRSMVFAALVGRAAARAGLSVYSGGSRGADLTAMRAAVEAGGASAGVLADSLDRSLRDPQTREYVSSGVLCLVSPFHPNAPFRAGNAMSRNKLIYCLSSFAVVVATSDGKGGTWAGATEALRARWVPVFVRAGQDAPPANSHLVRMGARPIPDDCSDTESALADWMRSVSAGVADIGDIPAPDRRLFDVAWPLIAEFISVPQTEEEVAARFDLVPAQVAAWLANAESKGLAHRSPHGWLVGSMSSPTQPSLFDSIEPGRWSIPPDADQYQGRPAREEERHR